MINTRLDPRGARVASSDDRRRRSRAGPRPNDARLDLTYARLGQGDARSPKTAGPRPAAVLLPLPGLARWPRPRTFAGYAQAS
jgi:hypothetical protein